MPRFTSKAIRSREFPARPRAFTLVELLVVISIIGILILMLLPAVNAAREAARRASCMNNLAQLSLALHNYEYHFERLPPGVTNPTGPIENTPAGDHTSWLVQILPYMEENALYAAYDFDAGAYASQNARVRQAGISFLQCPSSQHSAGRESGPALTSYAGCYGDSEVPIDDDNNGLFFRNSRIRYSDIYDGSSHTLLLGELRIDDEHDARNLLGWVSGTRSTLRHTETFDRTVFRHRPTVSASPIDEEADEEADKPADDRSTSLLVGGFGSYHAGETANFAFADGSVRTISSRIDRRVFRLLGNRADGEILPEF